MYNKGSQGVRQSVSLIFGALLVVLVAGLGVSAHAKMLEYGGKMYDIAEPGEFVPGEFIVQVKPGVEEAPLRALAAVLNARVKGHIPEYRLFLLELPASNLALAEGRVEAAMATLKTHPQVEQAFPNSKFSISRLVGPPGMARSGNSSVAQGQPLAGGSVPDQQWYLYRIKYFKAGPPPPVAPTIAIIDTGVDYTHPGLQDRVISGWDYVEDDADPMDENGSGTAGAGILASSGMDGNLAGISPTSKILAVRVLDALGSGTYFNIVQGIIYARSYSGVKILDIGWFGWLKEGSSEYNMFKQVIDDTYQQGILMCLPAGNNSNAGFFGSSNYRPVPAWFPNSFTVGATQEVDCRAYFSNYNLGMLKGITYNYKFVDLVAPGWDILSLSLLGSSEHWYGTGCSSDMAAGAAARVWALHPEWTRSQVIAQLRSTARTIGVTGTGFYLPERRLDLMRALGQQQTGFVGVVYNGQNGRPLPGVKVEALVGDVVQRAALSTNCGFFTLTGLTGGVTYTLRFTKHGFSSYKYGNLKSTTGILRDLYMPVFLQQERPADQWTVMVTWHSWHPGVLEAAWCDYNCTNWPINTNALTNMT